MSSFNQFFGGNKEVTSLVNRTGALRSNINFLASFLNVSEILSGSLTAGTLSTIYTHTGSGVLNLLAVKSNNSTARNIRVKITMDGNVIYDITSGVISTLNSGLVPVGVFLYNSTTADNIVFEPLVYNESLLVEVSSSLTEVDKISAYIYTYTTQ